MQCSAVQCDSSRLGATPTRDAHLYTSPALDILMPCASSYVLVKDRWWWSNRRLQQLPLAAAAEGGGLSSQGKLGAGTCGLGAGARLRHAVDSSTHVSGSYTAPTSTTIAALPIASRSRVRTIAGGEVTKEGSRTQGVKTQTRSVTCGGCRDVVRGGQPRIATHGGS